MKYFSLAKSNVIVFFILGFLVLVSTSVVAYLNFRDQVDSHDYISESESRINMLEKIQSLLSDIEASRKTYQVTNDRQYVNSINSSQMQIDSTLKKVRVSLSGIPKLLQKADTLSSAIGESFELVKRSVELQDKNGANSRLLKPLIDKSKIVNSDLQFRISRMQADEEAAILNKQNLENQSYQFTFYTISGATLVSSIIFILVFIILHKRDKGGAPEDEEITREELESIVRERTAEISQINNKLNSKLTELEQKDKDLMRSEAYYKMLFNQAHDAILIIDPTDERVLDANSRTCEIYSFSRAELIGLSLKTISKNPAQGEENLKKILEKGEYSFQTVHYNKMLNEMLIEINASVIDYNGRKAILSINRDITERVLVIH